MVSSERYRHHIVYNEGEVKIERELIVRSDGQGKLELIVNRDGQVKIKRQLNVNIDLEVKV